ncbi:MAG: hypothetical protein ACREBW_09770 [Candidatus Micrarchaeaceae archaeon]
MAEKNRYPQIPATVWWGVRDLLNRSPSATVDERALSVELSVQEAAARQYVSELKLVGILNEDNKATPIALKWRLDSTYPEAVQELVEKVYPEGLRHLAPPEEGNREKATMWFKGEGLGQGAAGNKAATYLLVSSKSPGGAPGRGAVARGSRTEIAKQAPRLRQTDRSGLSSRTQRGRSIGPENFPLNINLQIHISSDAGTEQIESIFSAMRRYLYDDENH